MSVHFSLLTAVLFKIQLKNEHLTWNTVSLFYFGFISIEKKDSGAFE